MKHELFSQLNKLTEDTLFENGRPGELNSNYEYKGTYSRLIGI